MYWYIYIYKYIYIFKYAYIDANTYICIYCTIFIYLFNLNKYIYICIYIYMSIYLSIYLFIYWFIHSFKYISQTNTHTHMCIYIYTYIHIYIYTYICYIHIHIYVIYIYMYLFIDLTTQKGVCSEFIYSYLALETKKYNWRASEGLGCAHLRCWETYQPPMFEALNIKWDQMDCLDLHIRGPSIVCIRLTHLTWATTSR